MPASVKPSRRTPKPLVNTAVFAKTAGFKPGEGFMRNDCKPAIALVPSKARATMRHRDFPDSDFLDTNATRFSDHSSRPTRVRRSASTLRLPAGDRKHSRAPPCATTSGDDASIPRGVDVYDSVAFTLRVFPFKSESIDRLKPTRLIHRSITKPLKEARVHRRGGLGFKNESSPVDRSIDRLRLDRSVNSIPDSIEFDRSIDQTCRSRHFGLIHSFIHSFTDLV